MPGTLYIALIPLLPIISFLLIVLVKKRMPALAGLIGTAWVVQPFGVDGPQLFFQCRQGR